MKIELSEDEIETIQGTLEEFDGILAAGLYWLPDDEAREVSLACQIFDKALEKAKEQKITP